MRLHQNLIRAGNDDSGTIVLVSASPHELGSVAMAWLLLTGAILTEVVGTTALKASEGFSRLVPSLIVVAGYACSFVLLSFTLKHIPVSVAYAVWAGLGTALIAVVGVVGLNEPITAVKTMGIMLIIGGTVALNLGGAH